MCKVDIATIRHESKARTERRRDPLGRMRNIYCASCQQAFRDDRYERGDARALEHLEGIPCLEIRRKVLPVKGFAHEVRLGGSAVVFNGKKGGPKHGEDGQGTMVQVERVWTDIFPEVDFMA